MKTGKQASTKVPTDKNTGETIEESVGQDVILNKKEVIMGSVFNCSLLNVRTIPEIDGPVITKLNDGSRVEIDESKSTNMFYSIRAMNGITGFCRKSFIKIL